MLFVSHKHFGGILSIVYILTNEAMPGYIKIGRTGTSVEQRMRELDKTSTPLPFQCYYAARVADDQKLERTLHAAFGDHRVRSSREFFRLDPYKARVVIELLALEDVTPRGDVFEDAESEAAVQKATKTSGRYSFSENGIPVGAILEYVSDRSVTCTVNDDNNVMFGSQVVSPSRAAVLANAQRGGSATAISGTISWLFENETLASIRDERLKVAED
jgi:hypothetical protein